MAALKRVADRGLNPLVSTKLSASNLADGTDKFPNKYDGMLSSRGERGNDGDPDRTQAPLRAPRPARANALLASEGPPLRRSRFMDDKTMPGPGVRPGLARPHAAAGRHRESLPELLHPRPGNRRGFGPKPVSPALRAGLYSQPLRLPVGAR